MHIPDINQTIGRNLRRLRMDRDLSQVDVARKIDSSPIMINAIERGRKGMGKDLMERICRALSVHPWEFFVEEDTPIITTAEEKKALELWRRMKAQGVAEETARYGEFRMSQAKRKRSEKDAGH